MGKYDVVNIKLDKTGGLTEALHLARRALEMGFAGVASGPMVRSSYKAEELLAQAIQRRGTRIHA